MDTFYWQDRKQKTDKRLTHNGRFGVMAALTPQQVQCYLRAVGQRSGTVKQ
ncbi:MAG: hypothetical protein FWH36_03860 [Lentimicrobiaceae bacterium]|nr:hypothetical protein [Lentimicrobiaceae bacterium]